MQLVNKYSKGDTIIEVLFAISIFSLVAVGGLSIMNKGNAVAQRALEITLVRQQIDSQAEVLRFANAAYISAYKAGMPSSHYSGSAAGIWANMVDKMEAGNIGSSSVSDFGAEASGCPAVKDKSFIFDTKSTTLIILDTTKYFQAESFSQVRFDSLGAFERADGIWIEAVRSAGGTGAEVGTGYIDFHIRACWTSIGQAQPMTVGTIVRLYEPR